MSERFEDRHRELRRQAGGWPYADDAAAGAADRAEDVLRDFYGRSGPLVDDLVATVRELRDAPRDGSVDIAALHRRQEAALAALDEEAGRHAAEG